MARFLIVGGGSRASALIDRLAQDGHLLNVVEEAGRLGDLLASLEHVAIVCWLAEASPERFLLSAVDSSMRGLVYEARAWEPGVLETAARNAIPVEALRTDSRDVAAWLAEAIEAIDSLIAAPGGAPPTRYAG